MSKYHNRQHNGYASQREAETAANLHALAQAGVIRGLEEQVSYQLVPAQKGKLRNEKGITYVADFVYYDKDGRHVVDSKGYKTRDYILKRKLMAYLLHIEVEEL